MDFVSPSIDRELDNGVQVTAYSIRLGSIIGESLPIVGWVLVPVPPPADPALSDVLLPVAGGTGAEGCEAKPGWGTNIPGNIPGGGMVYPGGDG